MRVIAGTARGTRLASFKNENIRPTLDRVKESLFSQIRPDLPGSRFLDLFAGTGNIGIEALSEGADFVAFVENHPRAAELIRKNLDKCRFAQRSPDGHERWSILQADILSGLRSLADRKSVFDLIYADPPFHEERYETTLRALDGSPLLHEETLVMMEHSRKKPLAENYGRLKKIKERRIGDTCLTFFTRSAALADSP